MIVTSGYCVMSAADRRMYRVPLAAYESNTNLRLVCEQRAHLIENLKWLLIGLNPRDICRAAALRAVLPEKSRSK